MEQNPIEAKADVARQDQLLDVFSDAVTRGDHEFAAQIIQTQEVLRPHEVVAFVVSRCIDSVEPEEQDAWRVAFRGYFVSLSERELPEEEEDAIINSIEELSIHAQRQVEIEADANRWESDTFEANVIGSETMQQLRQIPGFSDLERYAAKRNFSVAVDIAEEAKEEIQHLYRSTIDRYLYGHVEILAISGRFQRACKQIDLYASSPAVIEAMRKSLDKYVYSWAAENAYIPGLRPNAEYVIEAYGSTPERQRAMLQRLDMLLSDEV